MHAHCRPSFVLALAATATFPACDMPTAAAGDLVAASPVTASAQFSEWSPAVNLGATVNSPFNDILPTLSPDGLSLYFASNRPGSAGVDIWVARRASQDAPWGAPVNLGAPINTAGTESAPAISRDGHDLYFSSDRPGGQGSLDIWVSHREHTDDDFAWEAPTNLGPNVNSAAFDAGSSLLRPEFYFTSTRDNAPNLDIYVSRVEGDVFGPATRVDELSSPDNDQRPSVRFDGREIFFSSNRGMADGTQNIWVSTRQGRGHPWTSPVMLGPEINGPFFDQQPSISWDGRTLFFTSNRPGGAGGFDLYMSTRTH